MKEELKKYLERYAFEGAESASERCIMRVIDEFFDQYQPERSKREDSVYEKEKDDAMGNYYASNILLTEMRCSEHCGNTVRDK